MVRDVGNLGRYEKIEKFTRVLWGLCPYSFPSCIPFLYSFPVSNMIPMTAPAYLPELKSVLIPVPTYCESSTCSGCGNIMICSEFPMTFYDEPYCSDACSEATQSVASYEEEYDQEYEPEIDDDELDAYIDSLLDNDYDW